MTAARSVSASHAPSQPFRTPRSVTPLPSPKANIHSVGQAYPPRPSPNAVSRPSPGTPQEARISSSGYFSIVTETGPREPPLATCPTRVTMSSPTRPYSAVISTQLLPLDANSSYEAFRRQADNHHYETTFTLNPTQFGTNNVVAAARRDIESPAGPGQPQLLRRRLDVISSPTETATPDSIGDLSGLTTLPRPLMLPSLNATRTPPLNTQHTADRSLQDLSQTSPASKRNADIPTGTSFCERQMGHTSPSQSTFAAGATAKECLIRGRVTADSKSSEVGMSVIDVEHLNEIMTSDDAASSDSSILLLDVRVASCYSCSRLRGALNLCVPTTLLKRAAFSLQKLQLTFPHGEDQDKFAAWRDTNYLVVYDSHSAELRDAAAVVNVLKKFTAAGYKGRACMLRGGIKAFDAAYPHLVDHEPITRASSSISTALSLGLSRESRLSLAPAVPAPVAGGVTMPVKDNGPDPFFSNIRQNMDLADGVGRLDIALPTGLETSSLPQWLRGATCPNDRGQKVSEQFLRIELAEQARMRHAYAAFNPSTFSASAAGTVQLCGIEQGGKNRYVDILPFEHSRVRLQGKPTGSCDYVNASYIYARRSRKRYIASQGPLPATFTDFWSVVWDQGVRVIVMLTAESENGQLKCHPYWTSNEYGPLRLQLLSEKEIELDVGQQRSNSGLQGAGGGNSTPTGMSSGSCVSAGPRRRRAQTQSAVKGDTHALPPRSAVPPSTVAGSHVDTPRVVLRTFALSHGSQSGESPRTVTQIHYAAWPDFGATAQPSHLLALVELADSITQTPWVDTRGTFGSMQGPEHVSWQSTITPELNAHPRPMLVHCSAGCGRTGTFCTVDAVVDMLKRQYHPTSCVRATVATAKPAVLQLAGGDQRQSGTDLDVVEQEDVIMKDGVDGNTPAIVSPVLEQGRKDICFKSGPEVVEADFEADAAWLQDRSLDLIAATVEDFRTQRLSMVQSLRQFVLCYETVAEWFSKQQERGENVRF